MLLIHISDTWSHAIAWTVVQSLWQGMAIAIITGLVLLGMKNKTSESRYRVLALSMILVFACAAITLKYYLEYNEQAVSSNFVLTNQSPNDLAFTISRDQNSTTTSTLSMSDELSKFIDKNMLLIVIIWLVGLCISILRLMGGITYVQYLRTRMNFDVDPYWQDLLDGFKSKLNIQKPIQLLESALVRSPIVIGYLKPIILFPIGAINRLSENEVEGILAHELAHIMRHDYLINIIQNLVESLFYYHPAVWWLSSTLRDERENCCDDIAIQLCKNPLSYAKSLVAAQDMAYYAPSMAMAFAGQNKQSQLMLRINRIIHQPRKITSSWERWITSSVLIGLVVTISIAARPENAPSCLQLPTPTYIKFNINGKLDSLELKKNVEDGKYEHHGDLQSIILQVSDNHVTHLVINGLNVTGQDIKRFKKLIEFVIDHPIYSLDKSNIVTTHIDPDHLTMVDKNGVRYDVHINENGGQKVEIFNNETLTKTITLDAKNSPLLNEKPIAMAKLRNMGWEITSKGLQPIGGFQNMMPSSRSEEDESKIQQKSEHNEVDYVDHYLSDTPDYNTYHNWLMAELTRLHITKEGQNAMYDFTEERGIVNGQNISDNLNARFIKKYCEMMNTDVTKSLHITGNFTF